MNKFRIACSIAICLMLVIAVSGRANGEPDATFVFFDDFNAPSGELNQWSFGSFGPGASMQRTGGELTITRTTGARLGADGTGLFGSWAASACRLQGNFDVRIDYRLNDWPAGAAFRGIFSAARPGSSPITAANWVDTAEDENGTFAILEGNAVVVVPTVDERGALRLVRSNGEGRGYHGDVATGIWTELGDGTALPMTFEDVVIALSGVAADQLETDGSPGDSTVLAFDNVWIAAGSTACSPVTDLDDPIVPDSGSDTLDVIDPADSSEPDQPPSAAVNDARSPAVDIVGSTVETVETSDASGQGSEMDGSSNRNGESNTGAGNGEDNGGVDNGNGNGNGNGNLSDGNGNNGNNNGNGNGNFNACGGNGNDVGNDFVGDGNGNGVGNNVDCAGSGS